MLHRSIIVVDAAGAPVEGRIEIALQETLWSFIPAGPWKPGAHSLQVDTVLEDMAGNSIDRPFEVDVVRPVEKSIGAKVLRLPFTPK